MSSWVTVFRGKPWEISLRAGFLEEQGIATYQPDATMKVMQPFATGALPLDGQLQVAEEAVEQALALLAELAEEDLQRSDEDLDAMALATAPDPDLGIDAEEAAAYAAEDEDEDDDPVDPEDPDAWTREEITTLARRTRWAALLGITAPLAIWFGFLYLTAVRESGMRDEAHGLTVAAFWWPLILGPALWLTYTALFATM